MTPPQSIVLTGASSGIGAALARALAAPGRALLLVGRDPARLGAVAAEARALGARVETAALDIAEPGPLARRLLAWDDANPVDLLLANAGALAGRRPDGSPEGWEAAVRLARVNHLGTLNTVEPLLPRLRQRGAGQVALTSSLAALRPMPDLPGYSASKAAVLAYGTALRGALRPHGVAVSVICPGYVATRMTARHDGARPFEIAPARAARIILRGLARRRAVIAFPWPLVLLTLLGRLLPPGLSDMAVAPLAARIRPEPGGAGQTAATAAAVAATAPSISASECSEVTKNLSRAARSGTAG